jgi:predicted Zn-dependent peptidase
MGRGAHPGRRAGRTTETLKKSMTDQDDSYQKSTLPNGIRVVTERIAHVRSVSLGLWVSIGSAHEDGPQRGISHVIEHMLFKGTPKRSARAIAELMDSIGGNLNAFTDKEATCYHARVVDVHAPLALEVLSDMFLHSLFDPAELAKEKQVILEEIRMYDDSPDDINQDLFLRSVWSGSPLGEPIIGYAETVSSITPELIRSYIANRYTPASVIVTAAGNVEHEAFAADVARLLGGMPSGAAVADAAAPHFHPVRVIRRKDSEQAYLMLGVEGTSSSDDRRYPLSVLDAILGGGMASRLFQEIREKRGLVYSVYSMHNAYRPGGTFAVSAATRPQNAAEVIALVRAELASLASTGVTADEIARAKEHLKGGLLLALESTNTRMMRLGRSELNVGRHISATEVAARIEAVTKAEIDALAAAMFGDAGTALTVVGPVDEDIDAGVLAESA